MHAYQENSNDQSKETDRASKDFDNENLHKECRVGCVRQSRTRSNLLEQKCTMISGCSKRREALDLYLANTDTADKVGEPSGEASSEHGEASEVVVGEQLGVVCHCGWCVRLSKKAELKLSDC